MTKNWSSCKLRVILCQILMNRESPGRFSKNTEISNFTKIRPVGAEFHEDGQTARKT